MLPKEISYEFIRGDTQKLKPFKAVNKEGEEVTLTELDNIYFTMKNSNKEAVVKKKINDGIILGEDGKYHITLNAVDTQDLPAGNYVYDIELDLNDTYLYVNTLITGDIVLLEGVTQKEDR